MAEIKEDRLCSVLLPYLVGAVEFLFQISAIRAEIPFGPGHRSQRAVTDFSSEESRSEGWQRLLLQSGERKNARHCLAVLQRKCCKFVVEPNVGVDDR